MKNKVDINEINTREAGPDLIIENGYDCYDEVWEIPTKANTQYYTHGIYRFIGKFPPQIPREIFKRYTKPGMTILDPMCGSGTSLVEGIIAGCNVIGMDINPVSLLVSNVVTTAYDLDKLKQLVFELNEKIVNWNFSESSMKISEKDIKKFDLGDSSKYFSDDAKRKCIVLLEWMKDLEEDYHSFFLVALLAILRKISYANVKKINVTIDEDKKVQDVFTAYSKQLDAMMQAEEESKSIWVGNSVEINTCDARELNIPDESVDVVIIHPPYLSNTAFSESTQLQLAFLGVNRKNIWNKELKARGSYSSVPDGLRKYLVGWHNILKEAYRVLKPGGVCAIENGDGQVDFVRIPIGAITKEFAKDIGFNIEKHIIHKINNNTGLTLSHKMKSHDIVIMKKE